MWLGNAQLGFDHLWHVLQPGDIEPSGFACSYPHMARSVLALGFWKYFGESCGSRTWVSSFGPTSRHEIRVSWISFNPEVHADAWCWGPSLWMGGHLRNAREQLHVDGAEGESKLCRSELDDGGLASHNLHKGGLACFGGTSRGCDEHDLHWRAGWRHHCPCQQHLLPLGLPTDSGHECFSRLFFIITYYYLYFRSGRNCFLGWRLAFCTGLRGSPFTTSTPARQQALPSSPTTCPPSLKLRPTTSRTIMATTSSRRRPSRRQRQKRLKRLLTGALLC